MLVMGLLLLLVNVLLCVFLFPLNVGHLNAFAAGVIIMGVLDIAHKEGW